MRRWSADLILLVVLASVAAWGSWVRSQAIDPAVLSYEIGRTRMSDLWFDADLPKVFVISTQRTAEQHGATEHHPLASLALHPPLLLVRRLTGCEDETATRTLTALCAGAWTGLLYALLRLLGLRRVDSVVFTLVGLTSAAATFWFAVHELFTIGSVTILAALCGSVWLQGRSERPAGYVLLSATTCSITITNWSIGLLAAFLTHQWRRAVAISASALLLVCVAWGAQKALYPRAQFFLGMYENAGESVHIPEPKAGVETPISLVSHTMVMPSIGTSLQDDCVGQVMTVQSASPGSGGPLGPVAVAAWGLLLANGVRALRSSGAARPFRLLVGLSLLGQVGLHLFFGYETFLYSMHFLPLLVVTAALSALGPFRTATLSLAVLLVACDTLHNLSQFDTGAARVKAAAAAARSGADPAVALGCRLVDSGSQLLEPPADR